MKKQLFILALCAAAVHVQANSETGGFSGPDDRKLVSVADALSLPDESNVWLSGHIVKAIGDEKYEFKDATGTLVVEIDDEDWRGLNVAPDKKVDIAGEIDKEWNGVEFEVDMIRLTQ
jgi:uncharacterized protein (TIGR00156 family)